MTTERNVLLYSTVDTALYQTLVTTDGNVITDVYSTVVDWALKINYLSNQLSTLHALYLSSVTTDINMITVFNCGHCIVSTFGDNR